MPDLSPGLLRSAAAIVRVQARGKPHWAGIADRLDVHADTLTPPTEPDTEEQS